MEEHFYTVLGTRDAETKKSYCPDRQKLNSSVRVRQKQIIHCVIPEHNDDGKKNKAE